MRLHKKTTLFVLFVAISTIVVIAFGGFMTFNYFLLNAAEQQSHTAAEIVRVHLTASMVNGTIDKRQVFIDRLNGVEGLLDVRVARGSGVIAQYGPGLLSEQHSDAIEQQVMRSGQSYFDLVDNGLDPVFRATIPYLAQDDLESNCLQCHQVEVGEVLGALTIYMSANKHRTQAAIIVMIIAMVVIIFSTAILLFARRMIQPLIETADSVKMVVAGARKGDFSARIGYRGDDELGQIAHDLNALMELLGARLGTIASKIAGLIHYDQQRLVRHNQITTTLEMVESLEEVSNFKQAIEEDETKEEVYARLSKVLHSDFKLDCFSIYEMAVEKNRLQAMVVDGDVSKGCRWCDQQILLRADACRAKRTGHLVDGVTTPGICTAFTPSNGQAGSSHICVPLMQSGTVDGVVQLITDREQASQLLESLTFICIYLREASPVLEAKQLMSSLRESSLKDPMTGLHNRRFLQEYVDTLIAIVERNDSSVTILMLDIDYFKQVNDTYGHEAGDIVLRLLARTFKELVRGSDIVIRYGGEEFLIILLDTVVEIGLNVAEKIRTVIEKLDIDIPGAVLQKTISIGVAGYMEDDKAFWQVVKYADMALYQAKESGRNKVVRFTPEMLQEKGGQVEVS